MANFDLGRFGSDLPSVGKATFDSERFGPTGSYPAVGFNMDRFGPMDMSGVSRSNLAEALGVQAGAYQSNFGKTAGTTNTPFDGFKLDRGAVAYVDPGVAAPNAISKANAAVSQQVLNGSATASKSQPAKAGTAADAVNGMMEGISGFTKGLMTGDLNAAFTAVASPDSAVGAARDAKAAASKSTEATRATQENKGFFKEDTNIAGAIGAIAGGMFAGAPGAIAGGLLGQGIGKAFGATSAEKAADKLEKDADGLLGGVGRAMDSLFGGIGNMLGLSPTQTGLDANGFPSAPEGQARAATEAEMGQFSQAERDAAEAWGNDPANAGAMNSPGLY